ncbi:hypothetical protein [Tuberibacillus calidus]|uniref:hypothetical protein n=1 Tax=Tuberibacillus calidus TaxID=340097 RepID=UPI0004833E17|nr:hypothetical protein [Tuberibacillus calidus]
MKKSLLVKEAYGYILLRGENMETNESNKTFILEKYKEVSNNRRHYSSLRFALLPFYFAIQGWIIQAAFDKSHLPLAIYALIGILSTYVFWTIEERILEYYTHLEKVAANIEKQLEIDVKMFVTWPKSTFRSNTRWSIRTTYFVCMTFWVVTLCYSIYQLLT